MNQIELHKKIDALLLKSPDDVKRDEVSDLISANKDARQYFFSKANERWLDWLWENSFLDVIRQKAEDSTRYGYRTPEINYLVRIVEKVPAKVVDIMLKIPVSKETFNPEVVDRFLHICSTLSADQLARMVEKIRDERWIPLMGVFNQWGFEYEKMFKKLADAKDDKNILVLAETILSVRPREEVKKEGFVGISTEKPFYFDDLSYTKVFEYLAHVGDEYAKQALDLVTKIMAQVVLLGDKTNDGETFPIEETFHLYDVDFFTLEVGQKEHLSHRDDVRNLAAVIKTLLVRLIGEKCKQSEKEDLQKIFYDHIGMFDDPNARLPQSRSMWRLRLFALSLCPEVFRNELKKTFFRLFEVERYHEIISGAEYYRALQKGFAVLSEDNQREYVRRVIDYFVKKDRVKENKKEDWHLRYGSRILSVISEHLTDEEKQIAEDKDVGFTIRPDYEPEPSISTMRAGTVRPRGPITQEEFGNFSITEIAKKLRNEWTPEKLSKLNTSDDFLNPFNAEGAGELLRVDIAKRPQDYVNNAGLFFERGALDQHYTYSFLRGIQEAIKNNKEAADKINWDDLIGILLVIKKDGEKEAFDRETRERDSFDAWLAGWDAVHSAMTDALQELLNERGGSVIINFSKYRDQFLEIIGYLLGYPDPTSEDEVPKTAKITTTPPWSEDPFVSDPFTTAINSVRGRAFQAFVLFVYQDGKKFVTEEGKIDKDVKEIYESVLGKENTRALMFMFGHYLPTFYYRDRAWIRGLLPQIFPEDSVKKYLYLAAWEGYLANNLYEEMFFDSEIQKLYERGLALTDADYPKQKHFKDPDEGIAIHLALAFMYYKNFGFGHPLLDAFWKKNDPEQHAKFISFLGGMFISGSNNSADELLKKEPGSKKRLADFWDWLLGNYNNPEPFTEFGFWISLKKDIFEPAWLAERVEKTLEKTKGVFDWELGLEESVERLAEVAPKEVLKIARLYLLEGGVRDKKIRVPFRVEREWFDVFKILYENPKTKDGTYQLIDDLIREGGSLFWKLKEVVGEN